LSVLGDREGARALFDALAEVYEKELRKGSNCISRSSWQFWKDAIATR
jgi:hypothetical protein